MANLVEFLVKIKDLASGPLAKMANTGQSGFAKMEAAINKVSGKFNTLKANIQQIDARMAQLSRTREISFDTRQISRITSEMKNLQAQKDRLEGNSARGGLGSLLRSGLAIAGIGSMALLGGDIMSKGINRQINQISLETLVGKKAGGLLNNQLINYAQKSIYGNEVMEEGKLLAGSGVKARNVMPLMHMFGDLGMGNAERMKTLALAFSEANSTGYLTGRQEMMMRSALFNPFEALSAVTHRSVGELRKDMEKGKIGIDLLVKAMEYATGPMGRWYKMEEAIAGSGAGKWIAFKGALTTLAGTIGGALLPALGGLSDLLNGLINNTPALYAVGAAIGTMGTAWALYTAWTERAAIAQTILTAVEYWPLALIGATAAGITYLCLKYDNWRTSMITLWDVTKNMGVGLVDIFKFAFKDIGDFLEILWLRFKSFFEWLGQMSMNLGKGMKYALKLDFATAATAFTQPINTEAGAKANILSKLHDATLGSHRAELNKLFDTKQLKSLDFSLKHANLKDDISTGFGKYAPGLSGTGGSNGAADTAAAITGGGVRTVNIHIAKFQDKTEIHTASFKESVAEAEEMLENMFLRIVNSAATALN